MFIRGSVELQEAEAVPGTEFRLDLASSGEEMSLVIPLLLFSFNGELELENASV